jgi:hypothetical protein
MQDVLQPFLPGTLAAAHQTEQTQAGGHGDVAVVEAAL